MGLAQKTKIKDPAVSFDRLRTGYRKELSCQIQMGLKILTGF